MSDIASLNDRFQVIIKPALKDRLNDSTYELYAEPCEVIGYDKATKTMTLLNTSAEQRKDKGMILWASEHFTKIFEEVIKESAEAAVNIRFTNHRD
jgi:hypothetical protein